MIHFIWYECIISYQRTVNECLLSQEIPAVIDGKPSYYSHVDGKLIPFTNIDHLNLLFLKYNQTAFSLNQTLLHGLIFKKWVDFKTQLPLSDVAGENAKQAVIVEQLGITVDSLDPQSNDKHSIATTAVYAGTFALL